jgi:hypothetical protein
MDNGAAQGGSSRAAQKRKKKLKKKKRKQQHQPLVAPAPASKKKKKQQQPRPEPPPPPAVESDALQIVDAADVAPDAVANAMKPRTQEDAAACCVHY